MENIKFDNSLSALTKYTKSKKKFSTFAPRKIAHSKLKSEENLNILRNIELKVNSLSNNGLKWVPEDYDFLLNEINQELQKTREENEKLKTTLKYFKDYFQDSIQTYVLITEDVKGKLKATEVSLQDVVQKHKKAMEEVKILREEVDNKVQKINFQKYRLKLLRLKKFNSTCLKISCKKSFSSSDCLEFEKRHIVDNSDSNSSDEEYEVESLKALMSLKRIANLERNRSMGQGLLNFKRILKSSRTPVKCLEAANIVCQQNLKRVNSLCMRTNPVFATRNAATIDMGHGDFAFQFDYRSMLKEMILYCNALKKNITLNLKRRNTLTTKPKDYKLPQFENTNLHDDNFLFLQQFPPFNRRGKRSY